MPTLIAAAAAAAAVLGVAPFEHGYKDWILICDNLRGCTAKSVADEASRSGADVSGLMITVTRAAGPGGTPAVEMALIEDGDAKGRLLLDGREIPRRPLDETLKGVEAEAFLRLIRDGKTLTLGSGDKAPGASLAGLAAALLAMDEAQGRIGTVTALARLGPKPPSAVPPAPAVPVVRRMAGEPPALRNGAALAAAVRRARRPALAAADCDLTRTDADEAQPLTDTEAVVSLFCSLGAYQGPVMAFRVPRDRPAAARLLVLPPLPGETDSDGDGLYVEGTYDPKQATYLMSARGRGLGDCGESATWTFDGRDFHLSGVNRQERCGGGDRDWPTIYDTRVVVKR